VLDFCIEEIKKISTIPTVLFPGDISQISNKADAFLYLSLISGRNAEFLIGKHVIAAPILKRSSLEIIPTGYMLIDGGSPTTALYISNTTPIPNNRPEIAVCTAMAGELLGLKLIYMDAGSGADRPVSAAMIAAVSKNIEVPLIIGGGIQTPEKAAANVRAGADVVVVGNAFEKNPSLILEMAAAVHAV
jgi:phosphoglycerol geranylgeranyltransferase